MNCNNCLASNVCTHKITINPHDEYCWYTGVVIPKCIIIKKRKNQKK